MIIINRLILFIFLLIPSSWLEISKKNTAINSAAKSYSEANYEKSIEDHLFLTTEFGINSPQANYNLALSYQYAEKNEEAQRTFMSLLSNPNPMIASFASNHNGLILAKDKKYQEALDSFKYALIKDSENEEARYNYELLARWLEENKDQEDQEDQDEDGENDENQEDQENEDQENEDQDQDKKEQDKKDGKGEEDSENDQNEDSEQKDDKEGEKSQNEKDSQDPSDLESDLSDKEKAMEQLKENLKEMNLTPEQASQILDAMNAAELRYIQQNRKKPTKKPDKGLPDW